MHFSKVVFFTPLLSGQLPFLLAIHWPKYPRLRCTSKIVVVGTSSICSYPFWLHDFEFIRPLRATHSDGNFFFRDPLAKLVVGPTEIGEARAFDEHKQQTATTDNKLAVMDSVITERPSLLLQLSAPLDDGEESIKACCDSLTRIGDIARSEEGRTALLEGVEGGSLLKRLQVLITQPSVNHLVLAHAIRAIGNIVVDNDDNRKRVEQCGILADIIKVSRPLKDLGVLKMVCGCLGNACCDNTQLCKAVEHLGGVELIIDILAFNAKVPRADPGTFFQACSVSYPVRLGTSMRKYS